MSSASEERDAPSGPPALGRLVDHADALIIAIDRGYRITVFNQALARVTGRDPAVTVGRDVRELVPAAARVTVLALIEDTFAGRSTPPVEVDFPDRDGRTVRTVWTVAAVGGAPAVEALIAVGQDQTRLRSLERQIIQAEKLATVGQLAAGVVHELGNPLTAIIVYADYLVKKLERGSLEPGGADADKLRRILEGAERILALSRSLVAYAAPAPEHRISVNLSDVVRQALFFCEHVLGGGAALTVELAEGLPPLLGVRGQLTQVVVNLVTNAAQALPESGGRLRVATRLAEPGRVELVVEDAGAGIAREDQERIFEPFFTTKADGRGTGLGLSIVRSIVERHGASIQVDSEPGRGSIFTVTFPARVLD
jgi:PAS domain S-box-containing protein